MELAPQVADGKAGTLLQNHGEASAAYFECAANHKSLIDWSRDAVTRCAAGR